MSKITRKKLVKGTKIQAQTIGAFDTAVASGLNNQGIDATNLDKYESTFRLNWWLPQLQYGNEPDPADADPADPAYFARVWWDKNQVYNFPFILPATQDIWTTGINEQSKYYTLRDITFSHDQGDEPISYLAYPAVSGSWESTENVKSNNTTYAPYFYEANTKDFEFTFRLTLWAKTPNIVNDDITIWEDELGSWEIPYTAFINPSMGFNPFVIENLNIQLSPDKSYCFTVEFDGVPQSLIIFLEGETTAIARFWEQYLKNLQFSFRFSTPLRRFDTETGNVKTSPTNVQNFPFTYKGAQDDNISPVPTVPNTFILADPIQSNQEQVDHRFQNKLQGGHNTLWSKPFASQQTDLAAYDIITVQLLNNTANMRWGGFDVGQFPYRTYTGEFEENLTSFGDRKAISIYHPFTIHSAYIGLQTRIDIGGASHGTPSRQYHLLSNNTEGFSGILDVELVMHSGWRADRTATQQIAKISIDGSELRSSNYIDRAIDPVIQSNLRENTANFQVGVSSIWLFQMNLNGSQPLRNIAFYDQGLPYYVGRGIGYNSDDRTYVTDSGGTINPPKTLGQEKLLEARLKVSGITIPPVPSTTFPLPSVPANTRIWDGLCIPGITLYLVVKKSLVKSEW